MADNDRYKSPDASCKDIQVLPSPKIVHVRPVRQYQSEGGAQAAYLTPGRDGSGGLGLRFLCLSVCLSVCSLTKRSLKGTHSISKGGATCLAPADSPDCVPVDSPS